MRKHPISFRQDDVQYVMQRWREGESCALVGVGSVGKSNLLHHLADSDVIAAHFSTSANRIRAIVIDANMLGAFDDSSSDQFRVWAGYELLMHRLFMAFYPLTILGDDAKDFYDTYQLLQDGSNNLFAYMGLRYFELGIEIFMRHNIQLIFMFDEVEELFKQMPPKFFQTLRGIRDLHKGKLAYLTFSRTTPTALAKQYNMLWEDMEPFLELFIDNVHYVGPYNQADSKQMLDRLIQRQPEMTISADLANALLSITGGFAGLLRASFRAIRTVHDLQQMTNERLLSERLLEFDAIQNECQIIWQSLPGNEQKALRIISEISQDDLTRDTRIGIEALIRKKLFEHERRTNEAKVCPLLFRRYIEIVQPTEGN